MNRGPVASSMSTTKSQVPPPPTAGASAVERWRQWGEPAAASPIITALVIALVSVGVVGFQSLKGDIRAVEDRLTTEISRVRKEIREEIRASEARQQEGLRALSEDVKALSDKLDRVLESLLAAQ